MTTYVTTFRSTDTGAPTLSGTAGDLINVLSHCLIIGKVFSTTNDTAFTDNTSEARSSAGTAFTLFPTPATADRTYFGHSVPFYNLTFAFGTAGSAATYVWEYWNGSAWTSLTVTDGTSSFTANGSVTWTSGAASGWATTSVNGVTMYYVRVRFTGSAPSTNPLVNSVSYLGWLEVQSGTNQKDYKQGPGSNSMIASVNDNAASTAKEARIKGFETSTGLGTGTNQFPTTAQITLGYYVIRKSNTADAVTRSWIVVADQRTFYLFTLTGDVAGVYSGLGFGEFYSLVTPSDPGRCIITGRIAENSAAMTNATESLSGITTAGSSSGSLGTIPRDAQGSQTPLLIVKLGDWYFKTSGLSSSLGGNFGDVAFPNPADSKIYMALMWIYHLQAGSQIFRGRMRGFYHWGHAVSVVADGDTITGTGDLAGKSFLVIKSGPISDLYIIETSDTWETN